jgi:hypothetical protein
LEIKIQIISLGALEENGVGKFNDFTDKALDEIKAGYLYLVYRVSCIGGIIAQLVFQMTTGCKRKSRLSYAVKDYYNVNPDLAVSPANRLVEFEALIARTHKAGLKLIMISYRTTLHENMKEKQSRSEGLWGK